MELREAREVIAHYRKINEKVDLGPAVEAAIVLDDRITELEAQRDELKKQVKSLAQMVRRRESNIDAIERIARASDKEVKV